MQASDKQANQSLIKTPKCSKVQEFQILGEQIIISENQDQFEGGEGKWTEQQNLKFTIFIHYHQTIFSSKHKRKVCKIFTTLSEYIQLRTPSQCRSHYQKMIGKHKTLTKLKVYYKALFGYDKYKDKFREFKQAWEVNHQPMSTTHPEIKEFKSFSTQTQLVSICNQQSLRTAEVPFQNTSSAVQNETYNIWNNFLYFQQLGDHYYLSPLAFYPNIHQ